MSMGRLMIRSEIMNSEAVRLYGKKDLKIEKIELPEIKEDEILAKVITDSVCMSTYKAAVQGAAHKRVPENISSHPIIIGHEFSGEIVARGSKWTEDYSVGDRFSIQPNINHKGLGYAPGYSFEYFGGDATYIIIPNEVMEKGFLLRYNGDAFYKASLSEPMSCIISAFHASYHVENGVHNHHMGPVPGGTMALTAAAGPMGLGAIDYAIHAKNPPRLLVVTDVDERRLARAKTIITEEEAAKHGVKLVYVNTGSMGNPAEEIKALNSGQGYDDVFVFAPVKEVVETADNILAKDGCLNFFAGPTDKSFTANLNYYNVHYAGTHIVGTSGGYTSDMQEALDLMSQDVINPSVMITHIGGLDSAANTTLDLPNIPGGKKLIYTHIKMELTALEDFKEKGESDPLFAELARITEKNNGLWSSEAEKVLLRWFNV